MHEDIPILNFLGPAAFTHEAGRLTGVEFEKIEARLSEFYDLDCTCRCRQDFD